MYFKLESVEVIDNTGTHQTLRRSLFGTLCHTRSARVQWWDRRSEREPAAEFRNSICDLAEVLRVVEGMKVELAFELTFKRANILTYYKILQHKHYKTNHYKVSIYKKYSWCSMCSTHTLNTIKYLYTIKCSWCSKCLT